MTKGLSAPNRLLRLAASASGFAGGASAAASAAPGAMARGSAAVVQQAQVLLAQNAKAGASVRSACYREGLYGCSFPASRLVSGQQLS